MIVTKSTINSPCTVCPGAPEFSPAAPNWSEKTKHSELSQESAAPSMQINLKSLICYLL